ncbi:phospho-N-acetylmuramoyl-pentapeptide-transferase [Candidatus Berkelbacteria bacterium CG10_big_fil_rev_8_21_14_0_10_41_12]|uniref:Phospho-N-acetylmuramoyl-pentapeptide-transferase n=1 Tax=Candidatus Berkelbacteria bacterium CG10_big_fil_rev_8_21_14_0_10_41_12 TaxID=1974513 RepID=A0A2M6WWT6_9BACT|nr:MAG: phospho-N-acetylmuramoyl-pentapeptide-transferase [Candidatus Berkelbacteria bacterium CG10_big_fil_rev_8_21_14_0_10_41_12]
MYTLTISSNYLFLVLGFFAFAFLFSIVIAPIYTSFLYKNRIGKKIRDTNYNGEKTPIYTKLHRGKENTPTMGGVIIWLPAAIITLLANYSRSGTLLPLFSLVSTGMIGGIDDLMNVFGVGISRGGMRFITKLILYCAVAVVGVWWFAYKLDWLTRDIYIPFVGGVSIGYWYIPLFVLVLVFSAFAANQTDGLDGLAGGVYAIAFVAYSLIALLQGNLPLAVFCATVSGSILAFLWFNIFPARFFMGDTGAMSLGMTISVIAFLTNTLYALPFIIFIPIVEAITTIIQITSKRFFHRKVFLVAPIHHHFEAVGWPETKVTMRFWVISAVFSALGLVLILVKNF